MVQLIHCGTAYTHLGAWRQVFLVYSILLQPLIDAGASNICWYFDIKLLFLCHGTKNNYLQNVLFSR